MPFLDHLGQFLLSGAGILVALGLFGGKIKHALETVSLDIKEIKGDLKEMAPIPALLQDTRQDVRDLQRQMSHLHNSRHDQE